MFLRVDSTVSIRLDKGMKTAGERHEKVMAQLEIKFIKSDIEHKKGSLQYWVWNV